MRLLLIYTLLLLVQTASATLWIYCDHDYMFKIDSDSAIIVEGVIVSTITDTCVTRNISDEENKRCRCRALHTSPVLGIFHRSAA